MKLTKKIFMGALIATSLVCVPHVSKANPITNLITWLENLGKDNGKGNQGNDNGQGNKYGVGKNDKDDPTSASNSVPLDGGLILLMIAGLGLGMMVILSERRKSATILQ
jgi:hypothetical protein